MYNILECHAIATFSCLSKLEHIYFRYF